MKKEEIIKNIKEVQPVKGHNSMGASESWYNPYYTVGKCFTEKELNSMNEKSLQNLIKLANFASEVFY